MVYRTTPAVRARLEAQREAIVTAATELLSEHGYAACSVAAVAQRAGIATGTVYRSFPNKAELVAELFRTVVGREVAAVRAAAAFDGDVPAQVTSVIGTFAGRALKAPRLAFALLAEPVDAEVDSQRLVFRLAFRDLIAGLIAEGVAAGRLPAQDPRLTAAALVGAVGEALVGPLADGEPVEDLVPQLSAFALRALGHPGPGHPAPVLPPPPPEQIDE
ncbi:TetR/AcrR family transcriptional regulator [Kitasatospora sp. NPDC050543]|uniref:TetR/AcrR family transcriptional regulator n=1 Tax=Kitasatospora sp. NPDC050543 TaxID=3364054 RepID=UPI0037B7A526